MDPCVQGSFLHSRWLQPLPAKLLPGRASSGFQQVRGCSLKRQSEGKLGALTSFLKLLIFALLICTNLLPLQKEPFLQSAPEGPLSPLLTVGCRCSELHLSPVACFQSAGPAGGAGRGRRWKPVEQCLGGKVGAALSDVGSSFPGNSGVRRLPVQIPWTGVFLVSQGPCLQTASYFLFSFMDCA